MKIYYYINTGHRVGLDRLRRSAPVIEALEESGVDVTMLTNDFRAGEYAKEFYGIRKYISVDVVRNIANVAKPGDFLVFDSGEESRSMWEDMADYFRGFVRISDDPNDFITKENGLVSPLAAGEDVLTIDIVDPRYFDRTDHDKEAVYFWGDADYEMALAELSKAFEGMDVALLEGYYFFLQYADELQRDFAEIYESEEYEEILKSAKRFLTSSPQSALEALAAGSEPIYLPKPGADDIWESHLSRFGIPVCSGFDKEEIQKSLASVKSYRDDLLRKSAAKETAAYIKDKFS